MWKKYVSREGWKCNQVMRMWDIFVRVEYWKCAGWPWRRCNNLDKLPSPQFYSFLDVSINKISGEQIRRQWCQWEMDEKDKNFGNRERNTMNMFYDMMILHHERRNATLIFFSHKRVWICFTSTNSWISPRNLFLECRIICYVTEENTNVSNKEVFHFPTCLRSFFTFFYLTLIITVWSFVYLGVINVLHICTTRIAGVLSPGLESQNRYAQNIIKTGYDYGHHRLLSFPSCLLFLNQQKLPTFLFLLIIVTVPDYIYQILVGRKKFKSWQRTRWMGYFLNNFPQYFLL